MEHPVQVKSGHYITKKYLSRDRWMNYWHQLRWVMEAAPGSVLEVGVGNRVVRDTIAKLGIQISTIDIDPALGPDKIASVTAIPHPDNSFDMVVAAEVLEHLPWDDLPKALAEVRRVARNHALITLPHSGYTFVFIWKLPLFSWRHWIIKFPHFWKEHRFNGEHYWELGKKDYSIGRIKSELERAGFSILSVKKFADDPAHVHFFLKA